MVHSKLFLNHKSQSVRFHKSVAFAPEVQEVTIVAVGNTRIIAPVGKTWDAWFAQPVDDEALLPERDQPPMQEREALA
ncbi:type II toxin-antitoxin system VapB family antitoxin [Alicycliphilus denitrificans]|uniref:type II toxin-antitoxin system VapB family antitoxin n=1 Tax=Alicycliphilus denitrificans TaxID=179636 RepID=UPI003A7F91AA